LRALGSRALDGRAAVSKHLVAWRASLVADLGGEDALSTQMGAMVELVVRQKLLLASVDAWLLAQSSLVDVGRQSLLPVLRERQALADALARYLRDLGLERRVKDVPSLADYLAARETPPPPATPAAPTTPPAPPAPSEQP
jgi:hypothetical protein